MRHWRATEAHPDDALTPWVEALVQAVLCQTPRAAIATLDSAWHLGIVGEAEIAEIFHTLPRAYRRLRPLLDRRAESGTETLVRLLLRGLGIRPELQVSIDGVGRVDLVVDGWLIIECDSREHHSSWEAVRADRRRDAVAAALGYTTVRLLGQRRPPPRRARPRPLVTPEIAARQGRIARARARRAGDLRSCERQTVSGRSRRR